jgi:hypothetical protein
MLEQLIPLLNKILGGLFILGSEERKRTREISDLAKGLKVEILQIKNEVLKKEANEYTIIDNFQDDYTSHLVNKAKGLPESNDLEKYNDFKLSVVPESLDVIYNAKIEKLDMLEEVLISKVKRYYERFSNWKVKHQELKGAFFSLRSSGDEPKFIERFEECKKYVEPVIKKADELVVELDKKIKK